MKISILTLFPEMFQGPFDNSIIKHAQAKQLVEIGYINIRDFGIGKHRLIDDTPYGGGIGMVMRVDVLRDAIEYAKQQFTQKFTDVNEPRQKVVLMSASGKQFNQTIAKSYAKLDHLILICGHYEGIDDRIRQFIDDEISVGDFVVTGGEIPSMLITDAVTRLIPGVLKEGATDRESFSYNPDGTSLLEYPQFTRPQTYEGMAVPDILLSGNHAEIEKWRKDEALKKTKSIRPELLDSKENI